MSPAKHLMLRWTRTLHIYLTLLALLLLLFFAITGFMLNHADWFSLEEVRTRTQEGHLPTALLSDAPDKLAVVERLRADFGAIGLVDSFEIEEDELRVVFTGPGQRVEATIDRVEGRAKVVSESHGVMGHLTDLHRGKGTGPAWGLIIDGFSVLLLLVSFTGLALWLTLQRRRRFGLVVLTLSVVMCMGVYLLLVP